MLMEVEGRVEMMVARVENFWDKEDARHDGDYHSGVLFFEGKARRGAKRLVAVKHFQETVFLREVSLPLFFIKKK